MYFLHNIDLSPEKDCHIHKCLKILPNFLHYGLYMLQLSSFLYKKKLTHIFPLPIQVQNIHFGGEEDGWLQQKLSNIIQRKFVLRIWMALYTVCGWKHLFGICQGWRWDRCIELPLALACWNPRLYAGQRNSASACGNDPLDGMSNRSWSELSSSNW